MEVRIKAAAVYGGKRITEKQLLVLHSVHETGSINAAARILGISPPVAYRHIKETEATVGESMLTASPRGSRLTEHAIALLRSLDTAEARLSDKKRFTVACSPVTEELLMSVLSSVDTNADLLISDDDVNLRMLRGGETDVVILDDPVHVFDDDTLQWQEIGQMDMVHVDRGESYIRYRYGAQRIAFRHLDSLGRKYTIDSETLSLNDLFDSGKSFFIDEVLLLRKGKRVHSSTDPALLRHSILAVFREPSGTIEKLVTELTKRK
ncbi:MAG: LysR family transcriptional regulator [Methanomassiliicoccaceae archaeon]|nr:LysR family transcriptional regulator [Methanomassiliicoccaceae archaeon]